MLNTGKSVLADVLSISPSSEQRQRALMKHQPTHSLKHSAYPHQLYVDTLYKTQTVKLNTNIYFTLKLQTCGRSWHYCTLMPFLSKAWVFMMHQKDKKGFMFIVLEPETPKHFISPPCDSGLIQERHTKLTPDMSSLGGSGTDGTPALVTQFNSLLNLLQVKGKTFQTLAYCSTYCTMYNVLQHSMNRLLLVFNHYQLHTVIQQG